MTTGENIRRKRRRAGLTQWELSQMVHIRQGKLLLIERGQTECQKPLLEAIAKALGVQASELKNDRSNL